MEKITLKTVKIVKKTLCKSFSIAVKTSVILDRDCVQFQISKYSWEFTANKLSDASVNGKLLT